MPPVTDEYMKQMMTTVKEYTVVILRQGPKRDRPDLQQIIWEHGRRNFELREAGLLSIVCPVRDGSAVNGIGIFNADVDKTREIMEGDPGVKVGVFEYEIHPCRSFPGDSLPA